MSVYAASTFVAVMPTTCRSNPLRIARDVSSRTRRRKLSSEPTGAHSGIGTGHSAPSGNGDERRNCVATRSMSAMRSGASASGPVA